MQIQFGLDGEIVSADYSDPVTDPGKELKYTEDQKRAAAATVSPADAKHSPQQLQLDRQTRHVESLEAKANAIHGYDKDGKPRYVESESERARLLKIGGMERENLKGSLALAELSLGEDALDQQAANADLQAQSVYHDEIRAAAAEEVKRRQIQGAADLIMKANPKLKIG